MSLPLSITLEEHFSSKAFHSSPANSNPMRQFPPHITERLLDLHNERINNMDENGVAIQIVSHTPSSEMTSQAVIDGNDELAVAVRDNPRRLVGFAQLPMADPNAASDELERCVKQHGFVGALVDNHHDGNFYDTTEYGKLWNKAQELDVPIYLHPAWPSEAMVEALYSGGGLKSRPFESVSIGAFAFGWHSSTATTILRLLASRVFDNHPKLKIIIGHSGELLPYMFDRINKVCSRFDLKRGFAEVMHNNIWITTSGMFDVHSLRCLMGNMPFERILFSVDYPFSDNKLGKDYLQAIQKEKIMSDEQLHDFAYGNAKKLLFKDETLQRLGLTKDS